MTDIFTNDEMNLVCIYDTGSRKSLLSELRAMRAYLDGDETELAEITDSAIEKLEDMTDEEYSCLELVPDFI